MAKRIRKKARQKPKKQRKPAAKAHSAPSGQEREQSQFRSPWVVSPGEDQLAASALRPDEEKQADQVAKQVAVGKPVGPRLFDGQSAAGSPKKAVQGKHKGAGAAASPAMQARLGEQQGHGGPLAKDTRSEMEALMGADFSKVRVHDDHAAAEMNESLNARAFTYGKDIYFEPGAYDPHSRQGKELLAHELTHTVQQGAAGEKSVQKKGKDLTSPRFKGDKYLEMAFDGNLVIGVGSAGNHVRLLQQAVLDAGFSVGKAGVDGKFGPKTKAGVKALQAACGLTGKEVDGKVGPVTMGKLDKNFGEYVYEKDRAKEYDKKDPNKGTRTPTEAEKKRIKEAISTEPEHSKGGKKPKFKENITLPNGTILNYEKRIEATLRAIVQDQWVRLAKGKAKQRKKKGGLMDWNIINKLATVSKKVTDAVFGGYKTGPALSSVSGNLIDKWSHEDKKIKASKTYADDKAEWRVDKILRMKPQIAAIDQEHGALQSRSKEAAIIDQVKKRVIKDNYKKLLETHRNWPASAGGGVVKLQRYRGADNTARRAYMWRYFGTIIHEYLHTLADSRYTTYHQSMGPQQGGDTLREGVTDYFTKVVYFNHMPPSDTLRKEVEGPFHEKGVKDPIRARGFYASSANAEALAGIVGVRNLMAAFFHGRVELIGGK